MFTCKECSANSVLKMRNLFYTNIFNLLELHIEYHKYLSSSIVYITWPVTSHILIAAPTIEYKGVMGGGNMRKSIFVSIMLILLVLPIIGCFEYDSGSAVGPYNHELHINIDESNLVDNADEIDSTPPEGFSGLYVSRILYEDTQDSTHRALSRDSFPLLYDISENVELWVMPTEKYNGKQIDPSNTNNIEKFYPQNDGSFLIGKEKLPTTTFVIFVMNIPEEGSPEVIGFMSLETEDGDPVIEFPPSHELTGTITFGYVSLDDADYYSNAQKTLTDNQTAFTSEVFEALSEDVKIYNAALMALNVLWNTDYSNYYSPAIVVSYMYQEDAVIQTSSDIEWNAIEIQIYSHDTTTKMGLFRPDGVQVGEFKSSYGANSSVKWSFRISADDFNTHAKPREMWQLRKDDSQRTIIALFDLSVAIMKDAMGNPIIPLIDPKMTLKSDGTTISTLEMNWYHFDKNGENKQKLTDADQLDRLLIKSEYWFQGSSKAANTYVTYMFRDGKNNNIGGMKGDLNSITDISPHLQESEFFDNMGYNFGLYGIEVFNTTIID